MCSWRPRLFAVLVLGLALAVVACRGDDDSAAPSEGPAGKVVELVGDVAAKRGTERRRLLALGDVVFVDDAIITAAGARVTILFDHNGASWTLGDGLKRGVSSSAAWTAERQSASAFDQTGGGTTAAAGRHSEREAGETAATAQPESAPAAMPEPAVGGGATDSLADEAPAESKPRLPRERQTARRVERAVAPAAIEAADAPPPAKASAGEAIAGDSAAGPGKRAPGRGAAAKAATDAIVIDGITADGYPLSDAAAVLRQARAPLATCFQADAKLHVELQHERGEIRISARAPAELRSCLRRQLAALDWDDGESTFAIAFDLRYTASK